MQEIILTMNNWIYCFYLVHDSFVYSRRNIPSLCQIFQKQKRNNVGNIWQKAITCYMLRECPINKRSEEKAETKCSRMTSKSLMFVWVSNKRLWRNLNVLYFVSFILTKLSWGLVFALFLCVGKYKSCPYLTSIIKLSCDPLNAQRSLWRWKRVPSGDVT